MKLISMTDFVLNETNKITNEWSEDDQIRLLDKITDYAYFLKQPLKLEMFVPCINNEPFNFSKHGLEEDFKKAKEKVLFEGFHVIGSDNDLIELELYNHNLWIDFYKESIIILTDSYKVECPIKNIEDLLEYNLTLTPNAIKQLGL